ncbi:DUF805 domain-containing protein [Sporolactobacillus putidus]|uniref:Inner membrane protein YhaI n=1 Tax=Sporolactobacillus putidus TaxID=492735 RepID=A0A917S073_9BACL|nr:DUF805 domain-containing protein [Sporolactobacillus putidus]GGL47680.1 inner membrane protein YhaI [Sporolactobacillus putidus]
MHWYLDVIKNYVGFSGRATRTEFWVFTLINVIVSYVAIQLDYLLGSGKLIYYLYTLAVFLPSLAVSIRRLHDIGRTGWWILLALIPILGWIVLLIYDCTDSQDKENVYGPYPKASV